VTMAGKRALIPCPSNAAYHRHLKEGTTPCPGDFEAHNRRRSETATARRRVQAEEVTSRSPRGSLRLVQETALKELASRHRVEFGQLLEKAAHRFGVKL